MHVGFGLRVVRVGVDMWRTPGIASGPKWPCPGTSDMNDLVKGSYLRWGPMKHVALLVEPCEMKSWFSAAFMSSP